MNAWAWFWAAALVVAGASFAGITVIVAWKGWGDLRRMLSELSGKDTYRDDDD